MNLKTKCITDEQFETIISILKNGVPKKIYKNEEMAIILTITGNCALRIGDCLNLKMSSFMKEGDNYKFNIIEQKTGKHRTFIIPTPIYNIIKEYSIKNNKGENDKLFNYTVRAIQAKLQRIRKYLGEEYNNTSTHSFRKCAGMRIYRMSGNDIELTRRYMNHSSVNVTQRYLGVNEEQLNKLIETTYNIP